MKRTYLDWAATAIPDKDILYAALEQTITDFGNPSSPHQRGKDASALLLNSRKSLAESFDCSSKQLYFTGSGTESNNIIISSLLNKKRTGNIVISGIEHSAVYEPAILLEKHGWEVRIVNPEANGIVSAEKFCSRIDADTRMAVVIMVNNETGAIQPVNEIGSLMSSQPGADRRRIHFHIDAVQAAGKIPLKLNRLPIDSASISSHKFCGPRGMGLLYLKKPLDPVYAGGGQEDGIRNGTENTFGAAATAAAARKATTGIESKLAHAVELKKILIERISEIRGTSFIPHCSVDELLDTSKFSPYILPVCIKPVPGEILVRVISDKGFDIATGSACATGKKKRSRVMNAMGISPEDAFSTVRISTGTTTTIEDITQFCDTFERESIILINSLRR